MIKNSEDEIKGRETVLLKQKTIQEIWELSPPISRCWNTTGILISETTLEHAQVVWCEFCAAFYKRLRGPTPLSRTASAQETLMSDECVFDQMSPEELEILISSGVTGPIKLKKHCLMSLNQNKWLNKLNKQDTDKDHFKRTVRLQLH